ncbi:alpha-L-fucosidase [Nonomuraea sp. SYSU D8015]|uniref:alpha-L-fucosidase n=1 Tax=Nonomuraea sp. SYSU D8015 TaxID=2593644 RepID=UPI00166129EB|nr:alpha-L-fucosidase [Nonomuraea sp. SYSU D8015]
MTSTTPSAQPHRTVPEWFDDAKFGIMVVWTPASVPAFAPPWSFGEDVPDAETIMRELPAAEMYLNTMLIPDSPTARHHAEHHGGKPYDDFVAEFRRRTEEWDPTPWADLLARCGARYSVLVAKHQDGFLLWPSATTPSRPGWNAERDVVGEFAAAVRARGLRFGVLYTGGVDYTFGGLPLTGEMAANPAQNPQYARYADAHWRELIDRYEPSILWNDMGYPPAADPAELIAWYRSRVPDGAVNDRFAASAVDSDDILGDFATLEYDSDYAGSAPADRKWESTRGMGTSFGYNRQETDEHYDSATDLIHELVDCVARGGNFLLAVGPTATGEIPWPQASRLLDIGWWLHEHGHAIYRTRPWTRPAGTTGDGQEIRYTATADAVHAIVLGTPEAARLDLDLRLAPGAEVRLREGGPALPWRPVAHGVRVELPEVPHPRPAFTLRLSPASAISG